MFKTILVALLVFNFPFADTFQSLFTGDKAGAEERVETLEKMIIADGNVAMKIDLNRLNGRRSFGKESQLEKLQFDIETNAFFTVIVSNGELRGSIPSSMKIVPKSSAALPTKLSASFNQLIVEQMPFGEHYELVVRDRKTGFPFFNIEGHLPEYSSTERNFKINSGRLLVTKEFASSMRRPSEEGAYVGNIDINATMRPIEVTKLVNGEISAEVLPSGAGRPENAGTRPGPDVVVGDVYGLAQYGSSGSRVGLAVGTNSCNYGTEDLHWDRLPSNDHPVIPQNLYRMSSDGTRFEQIGQSQVKHGFTALTQNLCGLGCNGVGGSRLGSGCSDPYSAGLNAGPNLGSKAWVNPFTGFYPRGDSGTSPNTHAGHSHSGTSHRILVEGNDLSTQLNSGARYFAEGQYVTPHEYDWCQSNTGQCNMNNNASYREYSVSGVNSPFSFSPTASTVREKSAVQAWEGASFVQIQPDANNDGVGTVAYKVTEVSTGVWHYEYAVYNQNLDRAIQSFSVPLANDVALTDVGFYAPPQHPGSANDGTANNAGFSEAVWSTAQTSNAMTWNSESLAQNPNANAIRWGSMYNFRFNSTSPPQTTTATVGFLKTGSPITVEVQGPSGAAVAAVTISGRVNSPSGRGLSRASVSLVDSTASGSFPTRVTTNQFGYYQITGVTPGRTYTISVNARRYLFTPQNVEVNDNVTGIDFTAN